MGKNNKLKILLLFDSPTSKERGYDFKEEFTLDDWKTEAEVYNALCDNGYDVRVLGIYNDIRILIDELKEHNVDLVFNLTEVFNQNSHFEKNVAWVLEMLEVPYTGASPTNLLICNNKALSKKILTYHKIKVPHFQPFYRNYHVKLPKRLRLPIIIKPLCEEASRGISQASVVDNEEAFMDRVRFIHENMKMDAIAEEYIDGREFYVGAIGNQRVTVFPPYEMKFGERFEDEPRIATYKAKWDKEYQKRWGIKYMFPGRLPEGLEKKIKETVKRGYHAFNMRGYARFDIRVREDQQIFIIEANANPSLTRDDEVACAAEKAGIKYSKLIQKIVNLSLQPTR